MRHPLQQAEYLLTAADDSQLPLPGPPEVAFAGRSNAGKSSAINALANRTRLAFTSKTPGRTQQINFFALRGGALLADLPGYGYAAVPQALKQHWQRFLARYVAGRQSLAGLVLVVDIRHGLSDLDLQLLGTYLGTARPLLVLATKADKLSSSVQRTAVVTLERHLAAAFPADVDRVRVVAFSALRRVGVDVAEAIIAGWLDLTPETVSADSPPGATKEKAPRSRGVTRGPKRPR